VLRRRLLFGLTLVAFLLPACAYLWFIHQYGVNVPREDQWSDVSLIGRSYAGTLHFSNLWAAHNDHRIFFPNLLAVALGRTTHLNLFVEMYLSAALLFVAVGLLILTHRRRSPSTPWIAYCPVAIVMLSFAQYQDTLWGFQIAWYVVIAALAAVLFLLDRPAFTRVGFAAAIALAVVASYSLFQGLLVWPVGLVLLGQRRRPRWALATWVVAAGVTGIGYFLRLPAPPNRYYVLHHPVTAIKLFLLAVGDIFAQSTPISGDTVILLVGLVLFLVAAYVVVRYGLRGDETSGRPIGVALILFGLLFVASADVGTASIFGAWVGTNSLYAINVLLIVVGVYLAVLDWPASSRGHKSALAHTLAPLVIVGVLCVQVVLGTVNGVSGGRTTHQAASEAADVLVNIHQASTEEVRSAFLCPRIGNRVGLARWSPWCPDGTLSSLSVSVLRSHQLALFGTGVADSYAKRGLVVAPESLAFAPSDTNWVEGATGHSLRALVRAVGSPHPTISGRDLPASTVVADHHNGTATVSVASLARGTTHLVLRAVNRAGTLDVALYVFVKDEAAPAFVNVATTRTCDLGFPCNVQIRAAGWPTPVVTERGPLPSGMVFVATARGAMLSGQPSGTMARTYPIQLRASTGLSPAAIRTLDLTVR